MEDRTIKFKHPRILVVAQALLSQGAATAACSAFVAVQENGDTFYATYNHDSNHYFGSVYWSPGAEGLAGALQSFAHAVEEDANKRIIYGVPMTEGTIGKAHPEGEDWDLTEEGHPV